MVLGTNEREVLRQLVSYGESRGLELVKRSGGILKRGTVYVTLTRMEQEGLIESREECADPPEYIGIKRRLYRATGSGRSEYYAPPAVDGVLDPA